MAKKRKTATKRAMVDDETEDDFEYEDEEEEEKGSTLMAAKAPSDEEPTAPKAPGDLSQDELDEKMIAELKEKVVCATATNPLIQLTPEQATRLLALAGHPLGE